MHAVACVRRNWIANCSEANYDLRRSRRCQRNFFGPPWLGKRQRRRPDQAGARDGGIGIAIQTAKIAYPDYERESGTKWPDKHLDPAEAQLFAFAPLRALDGAGFDIVPKKDKPDADRP
jgi:hypothetical protein